MKDLRENTSIVDLKAEGDTGEVIVEVIPEFKKPDSTVDEKARLRIEALDREIAKKRKMIDLEDALIYNLTDHSDSIDRAIAASVGVLAAVLDLFLVDKLDISTGTWTEAEAIEFVDSYSNNKIVKDTNTEGLLKSVSSQMSGGNTKGLFPSGSTIPEKLIYGTINWFTSLVPTDTKLNGPMNALLDGIRDSKSSVKLMSKTNVSEGIHKEISSGGLNLTQGLTITNFAKQTLPVLLNECLVRAFYFIHRFFQEVNDNHITSLRDLVLIDWKSTIPFKNRTVVRMLTISTAVFSALDIAASTIGSAMVAEGSIYKFLNNFVLHINFIGAARVVLALGADLYMGARLARERQARSEMIDEMIKLENMKLSYKQNDVWVKAKNTEEVINESYAMISDVDAMYRQSIMETKEDLRKIGDSSYGIDEKNPGLKDDIFNVIHWE